MAGTIYHNCNLIVMFHTKCGQTSLYEAFGKPWAPDTATFGGQMEGISDVAPLSQFKAKCPGYFTSTFVRNPWDRIVSAYFYGMQHDRTGRYLATPFEDYVTELYNADREGRLPALSGATKMSFYIDCPVDYIGRQENLQDDAIALGKIVGVEVLPLRRLNRSAPRTNPDYRPYYNDKTKEMVREIYGEDIELFGYSFD